MPSQHGKIGIGVITCNRPTLFRECLAGIPEADSIIVVNDGEPYPAAFYPSRVSKIVQHRRNMGVGRSKNDALRFLLSEGCSHIFLCEDDIRVLEPDLCYRYIRASERTGILHFNFGYHGPRNKSAKGIPNPRMTMDYGNGNLVALNRHLVGAFSYYRDTVLHKSGFIDPMYRNMLDHVDHTYRIILEEFHPPFWWFADLTESWRFIDDLDPDLSKSTIRYDRWTTWASFHLGNFYFLLKHGCLVQNVPDVGEQEAHRALCALELKYGRTSAVHEKKQ